MINRGFLKFIRGKYILAHPNLEICLPVACQGEEDKIYIYFYNMNHLKGYIYISLPPSMHTKLSLLFLDLEENVKLTNKIVPSLH